MSRVVLNQRERFENDELFRKLSRETEIRYIGYMDRTWSERCERFVANLRAGRTELAFVACGVNLHLRFDLRNYGDEVDKKAGDLFDFKKDSNKVYLRKSLILNGVCVQMSGFIDLRRLDGTARIEYDPTGAMVEEKLLEKRLKKYEVNNKLQSQIDQSQSAKSINNTRKRTSTTLSESVKSHLTSPNKLCTVSEQADSLNRNDQYSQKIIKNGIGKNDHSGFSQYFTNLPRLSCGNEVSTKSPSLKESHATIYKQIFDSSIETNDCKNSKRKDLETKPKYLLENRQRYISEHFNISKGFPILKQYEEEVNRISHRNGTSSELLVSSGAESNSKYCKKCKNCQFSGSECTKDRNKLITEETVKKHDALTTESEGIRNNLTEKLCNIEVSKIISKVNDSFSQVDYELTNFKEESEDESDCESIIDVI